MIFLFNLFFPCLNQYNPGITAPVAVNFFSTNPCPATLSNLFFPNSFSTFPRFEQRLYQQLMSLKIKPTRILSFSYNNAYIHFFYCKFTINFKKNKKQQHPCNTMLAKNKHDYRKTRYFNKCVPSLPANK